MRTSQVMLSKGFGGAERYFVDLCAALAHRGHVVQAICHSDSAAERHLQGIPNLELASIRVLGAWDPLARRAIDRALRRFAPQIVHTHLARAAHLAAPVARKHGIPTVAILHNYVDLKYYRHIEWFDATTTSQRDYLLQNGVEPERIKVIPNFSRLPPIDTLPDRTATVGTILAYGRFVPKKGFDLLLRAFARVHVEHPSLQLLLGGAGDEEESLRALVAALGLSASVRFLGWIDDVTLPLDRADLFVLPSRDEPFGIVVLEAMARGVPIVSTRTQGPLEILDENTAWLCAVGDADDLARALRSALEAPSQRQQRAHRALERYREHYHEDAVIPRILQLYEEALIQRR